MTTYVDESFLGAGDLFIDAYDTSGNLTGERDVGNASMFAIAAPSIEKKEQKGFRRGNYAQTTKSVITKVEQDVKITLTDINRKNLALAMLGEDAVYEQASGTNVGGTGESVTARQGKWVKLGHRRLSPANPPVVKNSGETETYTEDTDYEVDYQSGRIQVLSTGLIADGASLVVYSTWLGLTGWNVDANAVNKLEAFLRLVGRDQANDRDVEVVVHKAQLEPSGDINWLTEDFATLELTGKILSVTDGTWEVFYYENATVTTTTSTTSTTTT